MSLGGAPAALRQRNDLFVPRRTERVAESGPSYADLINTLRVLKVDVEEIKVIVIVAPRAQIRRS